MKHRILLHTNPCHIKTGLAENAKTLLKYLWKTGKYDIAHYCSQSSVADPMLNLTPWKSYGCVPNDPQVHQEMQRDPGRARDIQYGSWNIENVIKDFKPTIYIGSDDAWGFPKGAYQDRPWWKQINSILHITLDSLPILDQAFEQALATKHYITWAKFASKEMNRVDPVKFGHVSQIYGGMDTTKFSPITPEERNALRNSFQIPQDATVFLFVGRNQLRKNFPQIVEAYAQFKRDNPTAKSYLHFHTSWSEMGMGWNIPKLAKYHGVAQEEILCTYVCKNCGQWVISKYVGEDVDCPHCKASKSMITANIVHGVPDDQMRYIYGFSDGCISAFTSGGQEYHSAQSLLCAKPLACTNYSCGQDFCEQSFVFALGFTTYYEPGTNFIKATTDLRDLKRFMSKTLKSSKRDLEEIGQKGRAWAIKTFSIEAIGAQWEKLFDSLPIIDWKTVDLTPQVKNPDAPFPDIADEDQFITTLYKTILKMDEPLHGEGFKNWKNVLKQGGSRKGIYDYFINEARKENAKHAAPVDIWSLVDKTTGKKRALFVIKESLGDCVMCTQLFESFHRSYPNHDLYVATQPGNFEIFAGNPYIFRLLQYQPFMEQEMSCAGAGQSEGLWDVFLHPGILTQCHLGYLFSETAAFKENMDL